MYNEHKLCPFHTGCGKLIECSYNCMARGEGDTCKRLPKAPTPRKTSVSKK